MKYAQTRTFFEFAIVFMATLGFSLVAGLFGAIETKFQIAMLVGMLLLTTFIVIPQKRTFCLVMWVVIQPLSIEKIVYTATPLWPTLIGAELVINAADILLMLLFMVLLKQHWLEGKRVFYFSPVVWSFVALIAWALVSYAIHVNLYQESFVSSTFLGVMHLLKMLFFTIVILAAIQTRADVIWVLLATLFILLIESGLVSLSYITGEAYNFGRLLGLPSELQQYSGSDGAIKRATGTLGVANQQAVYHAMMTFLLLGLLALKRGWVKYWTLVILILSFAAIILTFARTAWIAFFMAGIVAFICMFKSRLIKPQGWLVGGIAVLLMSGVLAINARPIIDRLTVGDDGATASRLRMADLAKDLFLAYPVIGVGANGYVEAGLALYPPGEKETEWVALGDRPIVPPLGRIELGVYNLPNGEQLTVAASVHNKYLLMAAELGLVGLMLWLLILYFFYKDAKICATCASAWAGDAFVKYLGISGYALLTVATIYMMLDLFNTDKSVQIILFPLLVVSAVAKLIKQGKI